jgi:signal transduction histidine kinase
LAKQVGVEIPQRSAVVLPRLTVPRLTTLPRPAIGPWAPSALAAAALGATLAVVALSPLHFAYPHATARVGLETAIALAALLATCLVLSRPSGRPFVLVAALGTLAGTSLLLAGNLALSPGLRLPAVLNAGGLAGASLLALAAFAPFGAARRRLHAFAAWALALALAYPVVRLAAADPLPVHLLCAGLFALAAAGFASGHARGGDELLRWLAAGAVCLAFARLAYSLSPPVAVDRVHVGDLFRALAYAVVAAGAAHTLRRHWSGLAAAAVAAERRRLARDLHDGVAQELALIQRRAPALLNDDDGREIVAAANRAARESRYAIEVLSRPVGEPLDLAVARVAERIVDGTDTELCLRLAPGLVVQPEVHDQLLRIAGEAVANAVGHGSPRTVRVELGHSRLRVVDDGAGFDLDGAAGFGLVSMRERARQIGAELAVRSHPGAGTEVSVELP